MGRDEVDYILPADESQDDLVAAKYRRIRSMAEAGQINEAENLLFDEVMDTEPSYLEMGLSFYLYLNEFDRRFSVFQRLLQGGDCRWHQRHCPGIRNQRI